VKSKNAKIKMQKCEPIMVAKGLWQVGQLRVRLFPPRRNTGHKMVATWRDESSGAILGYTLADVQRIAESRQALEVAA
jgi:hypothetical protein